MAHEIDCAKQKQITSGASCSWAFTILKLLHNHTQNHHYISTLKITESPQRLGRSLGCGNDVDTFVWSTFMGIPGDLRWAVFVRATLTVLVSKSHSRSSQRNPKRML
jgi:hypothetical protein